MSSCRLTLTEPPHVSEFRITHLHGVSLSLNSQKTYYSQLKRGRISLQGLLLLFLWACYGQSTWQRKLLTWQQPGKEGSRDESYSSKSHLNDAFFLSDTSPLAMNSSMGWWSQTTQCNPAVRPTCKDISTQSYGGTSHTDLHKVMRSRLYLTLRGQQTYTEDSVEVVRTL